MQRRRSSRPAGANRAKVVVSFFVSVCVRVLGEEVHGVLKFPRSTWSMAVVCCSSQAE